MGLDVGLEDEDGQGSVLVADDVAAGNVLLDLAERGRSHVDDELHQVLHAHVVLGGEAEDRHYLALCKACGQTLADLVDLEGLGVEILHHQLVVTLGSLRSEEHTSELQSR